MASRDSEGKESRWGEDRESMRGMGSGPIYKCRRNEDRQLCFL